MKSVFAALLSSASLVMPALASDNMPDVEIIQPDQQRWHIRQVWLGRDESSIVVHGKMSAFLRYGLPRGHIDIAVWSADNHLITDTTTRYYPAVLTRRALRKGGVHFSARLGDSCPSDATIKVAFHADKPVGQATPVHDTTVAR